MDNDILRVENFKDADKSVNSSHFKNDTDNNLINAKKTSLSTLVKNEFKDNYSLANNAIIMPKPKIFTTILLAFSLALLIVALALFCNKTKDILYAVVLAIICSLTIPLSLIFFFSKLDSKSNFSLLSILKMFGFGALAYCLLDALYNYFIEITNFSGYLITFARCIIDMLAIIIMTTLFYAQNKKTGAMTLMLIACTVASGFSAFKSFSTMFNSLFIKIQIFDGQSLSVAAIVNTGNWATRSISALFKTIGYYGLYQPLIFVSLNVIIAFSLNYYFNKKTRASENRTSNLLIIITCLLINALISVSTSIIFFEIIYNACAILFTAYMFYEVLEIAIKNEKYKDN